MKKKLFTVKNTVAFGDEYIQPGEPIEIYKLPYPVILDNKKFDYRMIKAENSKCHQLSSKESIIKNVVPLKMFKIMDYIMLFLLLSFKTLKKK